MLALACGSSEDGDAQRVGLLDPSVSHYGKTYAEWAVEWVRYINRVSPPECVYPTIDPTGASCALYQEPSAPVFFLAGTHGGRVTRTECSVPKDKALFFPLLNIWGDNGGIAEDMLYSDAELRQYVESNQAGYDRSTLHLSVDGRGVRSLEQGVVPATPYTLTISPEPNTYTCQGISGVEGDFPGYVAGYWALLEPLSPGAHLIRFGGSSSTGGSPEGLTVDVTYELRVE